MADGFFLMRCEQGVIAARPQAWFPKYLVAGVDSSIKRIERSGPDAVALVFITGADQSYLNSIASQPDAIRIATPANLDSTLNANQTNTAKSVFSALDIPPRFVNEGDTRRMAIRLLIGLSAFHGRMVERYGGTLKAKAKAAGLTWQTEWPDFPQALKNELLDIVSRFGWTDLVLPDPPTLDAIMETLADRWASENPIVMRGVTI